MIIIIAVITIVVVIIMILTIIVTFGEGREIEYTGTTYTTELRWHDED